jgi:hypothetical protein
MQEYNFNMNSANRKRQTMNRVLIWGVVGSLVVVAILLTTTERPDFLGANSNSGGFFIAFTVLGAIMGASILACREALRYALRQMVFVLNDNEIVRKRRGYNDLRIAFSKVDYLREEMGWLIVKSADQQTRIAVPMNMIGYDAIRTELTKHHPLSPPVKFRWRGTATLLLSILSWVVFLISREMNVMILAGAVALFTFSIGSYSLWELSCRRNRFILRCCLASMWGIAILLIYIHVVRH